jgi:hypothetical protein
MDTTGCGPPLGTAPRRRTGPATARHFFKGADCGKIVVVRPPVLQARRCAAMSPARFSSAVPQNLTVAFADCGRTPTRNARHDIRLGSAITTRARTCFRFARWRNSLGRAGRSDGPQAPIRPFGAKRSCATKIVHHGPYLKPASGFSPVHISEPHAPAMRMIRRA